MNGRTAQRLLKCRQQINPLLSERGKVAANAAEHDSALFTAKAARDFLLHLDHAQIPLGLVVVKRHSKVVQKPQHRLLLLGEAVQQITGRILFDLLFLSKLERLLVFLMSNILPSCPLRSELCQFFVLRHAANIAD